MRSGARCSTATRPDDAVRRAQPDDHAAAGELPVPELGLGRRALDPHHAGPVECLPDLGSAARRCRGARRRSRPRRAGSATTRSSRRRGARRARRARTRRAGCRVPTRRPRRDRASRGACARRRAARGTGRWRAPCARPRRRSRVRAPRPRATAGACSRRRPRRRRRRSTRAGRCATRRRRAADDVGHEDRARGEQRGEEALRGIPSRTRRGARPGSA